MSNGIVKHLSVERKQEKEKKERKKISSDAGGFFFLNIRKDTILNFCKKKKKQPPSLHVQLTTDYQEPTRKSRLNKTRRRVVKRAQRRFGRSHVRFT